MGVRRPPEEPSFVVRKVKGTWPRQRESEPETTYRTCHKFIIIGNT